MTSRPDNVDVYSEIGSLYFFDMQTCPPRYIRTLYSALLSPCVHDVTPPFSFPLEWELVRMDGLVRVVFLPRFPTELADNVTLLALAP